MIDTDVWPFIGTKHFTPVNGTRSVRVVVIHDMEAPEKPSTAEDVARYFATTTTPASAHICVDNDSIIQCVHDNDVAWAAPGCNALGIQIEIAGYGSQTPGQWADDYSRRALMNAANACAQYCLKYGIPVRHLTNAQLEKGSWGIIGHYQASEVYKKSTHTDPGPGFPWLHFIAVTAAYYEARRLALAT